MDPAVLRLCAYTLTLALFERRRVRTAPGPPGGTVPQAQARGTDRTAR